MGSVCERGEWPVLFADWMQRHPLLVEDNAGGADDVSCRCAAWVMRASAQLAQLMAGAEATLRGPSAVVLAMAWM